MDERRKSFEFKLLDQVSKIRIVLVGFFAVVLYLGQSDPATHVAVAASAISFAALYAIFTHFAIDWRRVRSEGHVHLLAALLLCADVLFIGAFVWAMGPAFQGLTVLWMLPLLFSALFFASCEVALVTGIVCGCSIVVQLSLARQIAVWPLTVGAGASVIVAGLAYLLARVARGELAAAESIVRHLTEGVIMLSSEGRIVVINPRIEHMVGIGADALIGRNLYAPDAPEQLGAIIDLLGDVERHPESPPPVKTRNLHLVEPIEAEIQCITVPCVSAQRKVHAWVVVCRDVTDLMSVVRMREQGVAMLSHELRGRLHSVRASSEVLLRMDDVLSPDVRRETLALLNTETERLSKLIRNVLKNAQTGEPADFSPEPTAVDELVRDAVRGLRQVAEEEGIDLTLNCAEAVPTVLCEPVGIDQAVQNLIENAIKFTPRGGSITVDVTPFGPGVGVRVADTGCGIPPERLDTIFSAHESSSEEADSGLGGGLGLGLAICQEVVKRHRGALRVSSEVGKGSTFSFYIP